MGFDYVVVQAGGKGTRLGALTKNKCKALVPVDNLPMIFHLFRQFPDKRFIIIGDYHYDMFSKYLAIFCDVKYQIVHAEGTGTCAGLHAALRHIPKGEAFMLIWSDLILSTEINWDDIYTEKNSVGISKDFPCRWSYRDDCFVEEMSSENGVAGVFIFKNKEMLDEIDRSGEFVKWLQTKKLCFHRLDLYGTREMGSLEVMNSSSPRFRCRPFNSVQEENGKIVKFPIDSKGEELAVKEVAWYRAMSQYKFKNIPQMYCSKPLTLEKINGKEIYNTSFNQDQKKSIIVNLVKALKELHSFQSIAVDTFSIKEAYFTKTLRRINQVRDLIPFGDQRTININGRECKNIFFNQEEFKQLIEKKLYETEFALIHGDCTFSNTLVNSDGEIKFIDPRGYFGFQELYGDVYYDWAKLYYSIYGDYDQFNNKKFTLDIRENSINLDIVPNGWRGLASYYLSILPVADNKIASIKIKLIHAVIWLSLSTYAWEDYDSICAAFYNGLFYLEEIWEM